MEVDGEVCLLLWQPAVGPWETLRVYARHDQRCPDVEAVLEAIQSTKCLLDFDGLEKAMQAQYHAFEQHGRKVWTTDIAATDGLQPEDKSRWVWTPLTCIVDTKNEAYTADIRPWILTGLEWDMPSKDFDED